MNKLITCILMVLFCIGCGADTSDATIVEDVLIPVDTASTELGDETGQVDTWPDADVSDDDNIPAAGPMMTMLTGETTRGFVDGTGREARFQGITCMTIAPDGSALYVSDTFNGIVRRVDTKTGEVTTIGGKALSLSTSDGFGSLVRFTEPRGLGITPDGGTLWIADGPTLRTLDLVTGEAITWAGLPGEPGFVDGDAVDARIGFLVHDIDVSTDGTTIYLSDRSNDRIRAWDVAEESLSTIAGGGSPGADGIGADAGFNGNGGIVRDGTTLYIADTFSNTVRALALESSSVVTIAGQAGQMGSIDGDQTTATLDSPQGLALKDDILYAAGFDGQLRTIDRSNGQVGTLPLAGLTGTFSPPIAAPSANRLYYADLATDAVLSINLDSLTVTPLAGPVQPEGYVDGALSDARFGWIYGLAASDDGKHLYVADPSNKAVRVIDLEAGEVTSITNDAWEAPVGLALDEAAGRVFMSDATTGQLWVITLDGLTVESLGDGGLDTPWGLTFAGNILYVAEHQGLRIQAVNVATGTTTLVAGTGEAGNADGPALESSFQGPLGMTYDEDSNVLYVADYVGHTIRRININEKTVSTVAGDGSEGSEDGSPGRLFQPSGVIVQDGQLLITDTGNHTVRLWHPKEGLTTVVGRPGVGAAIGSGEGVVVSEATLAQPEALTMGATGLYISVEYGVMHVPQEAFEFMEVR